MWEWERKDVKRSTNAQRPPNPAKMCVRVCPSSCNCAMKLHGVWVPSNVFVSHPKKLSMAFRHLAVFNVIGWHLPNDMSKLKSWRWAVTQFFAVMPMGHNLPLCFSLTQQCVTYKYVLLLLLVCVSRLGANRKWQKIKSFLPPHARTRTNRMCWCSRIDPKKNGRA